MRARKRWEETIKRNNANIQLIREQIFSVNCPFAKGTEQYRLFQNDLQHEFERETACFWRENAELFRKLANIRNHSKKTSGRRKVRVFNGKPLGNEYEFRRRY